tara:strand:+ start:50 stop:1078 length:1029 start_codon:yes stop_codon:yes gene_type:complete
MGNKNVKRNINPNPFWRAGFLGPDQTKPFDWNQRGLQNEQEPNRNFVDNIAKYGPGGNLTGREELARQRQLLKLQRLKEEGHPWAMKPENQQYYDSGVVNIEGAKANIGSSSFTGGGDQSSAPTVNPGADRERNQQSDMAAMLQQYGKVPLDPAGGAVMGAAIGLGASGGKALPTLLGAGAGYLLARSNSILLPGQKPEGESEAFDASQAIDGTAPVESQTEVVSQEKADISGMYPGVDQLGEGGMAFAPGFTNAAANRSNTFGQDVTTLLAQSAKTTGDQVQGGNMQPQIGTVAGVAGLEVPAPGGQPGNVPNPADELVASFSKGRVPQYIYQTLGGGSLV